MQKWIGGWEVDFRLRPTVLRQPWEVVGEVAAAIHAIDPEPVRGVLPAYATRQEHALTMASSLEDIDEPETSATHDWIRAHLPPATPSSLLHGDLLGQNLREDLEGDGISVLDWGEAAIGDPAYDLAIVTRGVKKPFGTERGLRLLLDAYNVSARAPLTMAEVRLHELVLMVHWYRDTCEGYGRGSPHADNHRRAWASAHDEAQGHITSDGLIIDGKEITFDELATLLQTHEGFRFSLETGDIYDAT